MIATAASATAASGMLALAALVLALPGRCPRPVRRLRNLTRPRQSSVDAAHEKSPPPRLVLRAAILAGLAATVLVGGPLGDHVSALVSGPGGSGVGLLVCAAVGITGVTVVVVAARRFPDRFGGSGTTAPQVWLELPTALELLSACLSAGRPADAAAGQVSEALGGPVGDRLAVVARASALGSPPVRAWQPLASLAPAGPAVRALVRATDSGTDLARGLLRAAGDVRAARAAAADRRVHRTAVLVVLPLGLCFLPAFVCLGIIPVVVSILGAGLR